METLFIIMAIMVWVLLALACICLLIICYIKLTYLKWEKDEKELQRFITINKNFSDYSEKGK